MATIADELRALELRIAAPAPTAQRGSVAHLFADDFREIGASGRTYDKARALATLVAAPPQQIAIENFTVRELGADHVLATYLARTPGRVTLRSSIWVRRAGGWQIVFHQGTPAE
jgi:hypothetical protein